jgi:hypothetical protein
MSNASNAPVVFFRRGHVKMREPTLQKDRYANIDSIKNQRKQYRTCSFSTLSGFGSCLPGQQHRQEARAKQQLIQRQG